MIIFRMHGYQPRLDEKTGQVVYRWVDDNLKKKYYALRYFLNEINKR